MNRVFVAVTAELLQFQACRCVATVLHGCVAGNTRRSLVWVTAALSAFQGNNNANAFLASHTSTVRNSNDLLKLTQFTIISCDASSVQTFF